MKARATLSLVLALFINSSAMALEEVASATAAIKTAAEVPAAAAEKALGKFEKLEQELLAEQQEINDRYEQFIQEKMAHLKELEEAADTEMKDMYSLKTKLASFADQFEKSNAVKEFWGDVSSFTKNTPEKFTINFDTEHQTILVKSDELDVRGRPILEYQLDKKTGHTIETIRKEDGTETQKKEKDVKIETPPVPVANAAPTAPAAHAVQDIHADSTDLATVGSSTLKVDQIQAITDEWNDLEKQRDLAFKIMYFFIVFMMGTFVLLYIFFKMTQSEEHQATIKKQKMMREANNSNRQDFSHIDDECNTINPYRTKLPTKVSTQFTSSAMPFTNLAEVSYAKAQEFKQRSINNSFNNDHLDTTINSRRENQQISETRNLYQENQEDGQNYATYNQEADYQLLSNMYASQNGY